MKTTLTGATRSSRRQTLTLAAWLVLVAAAGWLRADSLDVWNRAWPVPAVRPGPIFSVGDRLMTIDNYIWASPTSLATCVWSSTNGLTWTAQNNAALGRVSVSAVVAVAAGFLAVGGNADGGVVLTSADGLTWDSPRTVISNFLAAAAAGPDRNVAVGATGTIVTSVGQGAWMLQSSPTTKDLVAVAYGGAFFLALATSRQEFDPISSLISADGIRWQARPCDLADVPSRLLAGGAGFVALVRSTIFTSGDGLAWNQNDNIDESITDLVFAKDKFVAVGKHGAIFSSNDGVTWQRLVSGTDEMLSQIGFAHDKFFVWGQTQLLTSTDLKTWNQRSLASGPDLSDSPPVTLKSLNGTLFCALTHYLEQTNLNELWASTDLVHWQHQVLGPIADIAYGNGLYVAVSGPLSDATLTSEILFTSRDGLTWTTQPAPAPELSHVCFGDGTFLASGSGTALFLSSNATSWTEIPMPTPSAITYGNDRSVIVTLDGATFTCQPGKGPLRAGAKLNAGLRDVTYGNGTFVAVGSRFEFDEKGRVQPRSFNIFTSNDGLNWEEHDSGFDGQFTSVAYGNGVFIAVAPAGAGWAPGHNDVLVSSTDGMHWGLRLRASEPTAVVFGNGRFVVNAMGLIGSNPFGPRLLPIWQPGQSSPAVRVLGEAGKSYQLENSSDLIHWSNWAAPLPSDATFPLLDMNLVPHLFFRTKP
jgi:hypothetical protein